MPFDRRTFLQNAGVAAFAAVAIRRLGAAPVPTSLVPALPRFDASHPDAFWAAVRAQYPLRDDPVYLNCGGLGPTPQPVLNTVFETMTAMQQHSEPEHPQHVDPARKTMARFLGVEPAEICFVRNTTEGNSIVAAGLRLQAGDEVIFESHAHPGGSYPWFNQAKQRGIVVRLFEPDHEHAEGNVERIRTLITPRTKVIQVSHLTCTTGLAMPVRAIAALAQAHGIWFHIDGAQSVGMIPVNIDAIGCDSYATSGHKWLGGPHETGIFYLRRARLEEVAVPEIGSYSGDLPFLPGTIALEPSATRFEYGTRNLGLIAGLETAVRFQEEIGRERIAAHGHELVSRLIDGISGVDGIEILTPRLDAMRGSMATIRHARANPGRLTGYLQKKHRLRCRPVGEQKLEAVRISFHVFNSAAECDRVIAAVRASARDL
ncbi:MAG: L-cysteine/cystine lyase [Verrucomicrobia bacterium]|nr:L-cysteine/cystine lyase [Verrucomicrobiota bacterium]